MRKDEDHATNHSRMVLGWIYVTVSVHPDVVDGGPTGSVLHAMRQASNTRQPIHAIRSTL